MNKKRWHIYMMEYYSGFRKEGNPIICDNVDKPGGHLLSKSETQKEKYCTNLLICSIYS
jgi:hypothetical protein